MSHPSRDADRERPHTSRELPAWRVVAGLIGFRPRLWLTNLTAMSLLVVAALIPAIAIRDFFGLLSSERAADFDLLTVFALLAAAWLGRCLGTVVLVKTYVPFWIDGMALLRRNLLRGVLRRPGASALPDSPGEAISRFRRDVFEQPLFSLWLNNLIGDTALALIAIGVMVSIDPWITVVALAPFLVVGLIARATTERIDSYRRISRRWAGRVCGFIGETFGGVQAVKVAGAEAGVLGRFAELNEGRRKAALEDQLFNEVLQSLFRNAVTLGQGVILLLAARAMRRGTFTVGDFALFVFYLEFISNATAFAGLLVARYRQIGISIERMERLTIGCPASDLIARDPIDLRPEHPPRPLRALEPGEALRTLEARGLAYRFDGGSEPALDGVDLRLERGTLTVVTGRVGSGKTTLLRVLLGLLDRSDGEIRWNGQPVDDPGSQLVPPRAAYTAQVPRLFSEPLRANLLMGLPPEQERIEQAVADAVLDDDLAALPDGLETEVGAKGVKLSGGQVQRAAAARMLIREPELLVFDDLSSALDVETERKLWERVLDGKRQRTVLAVSHRRAALHRADQIMVMEGGRCVDRGALDELLPRCAVLREIWDAS